MTRINSFVLLLLFVCIYPSKIVYSKETEEQPPPEENAESFQPHTPSGNICDKYPSLRECRSPTPASNTSPTTTRSRDPTTTSPPLTEGTEKPTTTISKICEKYPSLSECRPSTPTSNTSPTTTRPRDPYCDLHKTQFVNNCEKQFTDPKQKDFCDQYGVRCRGWKRLGQPKSFKDVNSNSQARPWPRMNGGGGGGGSVGTGDTNARTSQDKEYCHAYGKDYYALCLNTITADAQAFCTDFSQTCPGVPRPGGGIGGGGGRAPQSDVEMTDQQYCKAYRADYNSMCLKNPIMSEAITFCDGYSKVCRGVPRPGSRG